MAKGYRSMRIKLCYILNMTRQNQTTFVAGENATQDTIQQIQVLHLLAPL